MRVPAYLICGGTHSTDLSVDLNKSSYLYPVLMYLYEKCYNRYSTGQENRNKSNFVHRGAQRGAQCASKCTKIRTSVAKFRLVPGDSFKYRRECGTSTSTCTFRPQGDNRKNKEWNTITIKLQSFLYRRCSRPWYCLQAYSTKVPCGTCTSVLVETSITHVQGTTSTSSTIVREESPSL